VLFFDKRPAGSDPWTEKFWVYDFRTNQHFTQKQNPLRRSHLDEFVDCYKPGRPHSERVESERFKAFTYDELTARRRSLRRAASFRSADIVFEEDRIYLRKVERVCRV
jgi:type I restriction enzyme M protein